MRVLEPPIDRCLAAEPRSGRRREVGTPNYEYATRPPRTPNFDMLAVKYRRCVLSDSRGVVIRLGMRLSPDAVRSPPPQLGQHGQQHSGQGGRGGYDIWQKGSGNPGSRHGGM